MNCNTQNAVVNFLNDQVVSAAQQIKYLQVQNLNNLARGNASANAVNDAKIASLKAFSASVSSLYNEVKSDPCGCNTGLPNRTFYPTTSFVGNRPGQQSIYLSVPPAEAFKPVVTP